MLPDTWPLWAQVITGIGLLCGALTGIAVFLAKTGRGVKIAASWVRGVVVDAITDVVKEHTLSPEQVSELVTDIVEAKVAPIHAEVRPNGGASLKDQVTRIDTRLRDHITNSTVDRIELRRWLEQLDPHHPGRTDQSPPDGGLSP